MPRKRLVAAGVQHRATTLATVAEGCCNKGPLQSRGGIPVADRTPRDFDRIGDSVLQHDIEAGLLAAYLVVVDEILDRFLPPVAAMTIDPASPAHDSGTP